jgi:hypothetical protein
VDTTQKAKSPKPKVEEGDGHRPGDDGASDRVIGPESHDESEDAKAKVRMGEVLARGGQLIRFDEFMTSARDAC